MSTSPAESLEVVTRLVVLGEIEAHALVVLIDPKSDDRVRDLEEHEAGDAGPDCGDERRLELDPDLIADGEAFLVSAEGRSAEDACENHADEGDQQRQRR